MVSKPIMFVLLGFYFVLAFSSLVEGRGALTIYWIGAFILNMAVLQMAY